MLIAAITTSALAQDNEEKGNPAERDSGSKTESGLDPATDGDGNGPGSAGSSSSSTEASDEQELKPFPGAPYNAPEEAELNAGIGPINSAGNRPIDRNDGLIINGLRFANKKAYQTYIKANPKGTAPAAGDI